MKRSSLFYIGLAAALLTGLAHLRADWLGGAPDRPAPACARSEQRAAVDAARHGAPWPWRPFLRR
jgi:hypothetical protein